jgi:acyl-CoA thioester hydrolase
MTAEKQSSARIVESRLRVRYAETDSMGIVYHANYLIWMEVGRTDYFRALGFAYRDLEQQYKLHTPLVEVYCRYLAPACYDDEIIVRTQVKQLNKRLVRFSYQVARALDECRLAEGESVHLVVDSQRRRATFPDAVMAAFRDC